MSRHISASPSVAVAGLWHLGTVTAACLASRGISTLGYDPDPEVVAGLAAGRPPLFEPGLEDLVREGVKNGTLRFSNDRAALAEAEIVWVAWDTPVDEEDRADVEFVIAQVITLFPHLKDDALVLVSSQLPVGSVRRLEQAYATLMPSGHASFACSPENLRLGKAIEAFTKPDRVILGVRSEQDADRVRRLLAPFSPTIEVVRVESAEMTKHALNAFLATSVAFINEIARLGEVVGADAREVERALKSDVRIGPRAYVRAGGAYAGGTLARDVSYLIEQGEARGHRMPLFHGVRDSNDLHRGWAYDALVRTVGQLSGHSIAVLGLTYKPGTDTLRPIAGRGPVPATRGHRCACHRVRSRCEEIATRAGALDRSRQHGARRVARSLCRCRSPPNGPSSGRSRLMHSWAAGSRRSSSIPAAFSQARCSVILVSAIRLWEHQHDTSRRPSDGHRDARGTPPCGRDNTRAFSAMRIGFDGRSLASPAGGVRRYAGELLDGLVRVNPSDTIVVFGAPADATQRHAVQGRSVTQIFPTNLGWSLVDLPRAIRNEGLDVFHAPAYTAPLHGAHPLALTIHDVSYERHPEWYPYRRDPIRRWFYRRSARTADVIITDSDFSRREIAAAYGFDPSHIKVVPLGVGGPFLGSASPRRPADVKQPYVLHVGDLHVRRNLRTLVRALARLPSVSSEITPPPLVLAGSDRGERANIESEARRANIQIRFPGPVDDDALVALYAGAAAFVYPSRYEGFGLPLLEAMACGAPVVGARAGAIPEVVGDAGILVDPDDELEMAAAISRLMTNTEVAGRLRSAGRKRAMDYTWARTARQTAEAYEEAIDRVSEAGRRTNR